MSRNLFESALAAEGASGKFADLARSVFMQESGGGRNTKTSNAGAVGGMQIIPATFASVADKGWDINNPEHNTRAGIRYLQQMFQKADGNPELAAVGYYGGPGAILKAMKGVAVSDPRNPNAPNTLEYGKQVAGRLPAESSVAVAPSTQEVAPVQAPIQVAQANTPQGPVPVGYVAPDTGGWQEFQKAMPGPVTATALNFGSAPAKFNPLAYGPANSAVDFRAFGGLGRKGRA